jgi:hypothetical protein
MQKHEDAMSKLNFKLTNTPRPTAVEKRSKSPRQVVQDGISTQIALIKDPDFSIPKTRYVKVIEDGQEKSVRKNVTSKPRPWFWLADDGQYMLQIRYGSSIVVELEKGNPTIIAGKTTKDVQRVLEQVSNAVDAGDMDEQIMTAKTKTKRSK